MHAAWVCFFYESNVKNGYSDQIDSCSFFYWGFEYENNTRSGLLQSQFQQEDSNAQRRSSAGILH